MKILNVGRTFIDTQIDAQIDVQIDTQVSAGNTNV